MAKPKKELDLVSLIIDKKVWIISRLMAKTIINNAIESKKKQGKPSIICVSKGKTFVLQNADFETKEELLAESDKWVKGGYTCYHYLPTK